MQYAMRNLHPERLFTVRPLKVFAYILMAHMPTLCVVVSNCIDITSPTRPMLAMFGIVHLQAKQSRLLIIVLLIASSNATRVEWQTQCNDYGCTNPTDILAQTRYNHTFQFCMSNTYKRAVILNYKGLLIGMFAITRTFMEV